MKKTNLLLSFVLVLLATSAQAQVPGLINYQGRVTVGTTNFNSPPNGLFKFVLTNSAGTYYWSNDGTANTYGSEPTNAVSLTVSKGLYSVLLGDTSIANMTAIPASVWANPDVRLRVWFNDGVNGSQLLIPDQRLAPTAYLSSGINLTGITLGGTTNIAGDLNLPATTSASTGVLNIGGQPFLHTYAPGGVNDGNTFVGSGAGNFTLTGGANTASGFDALSHNTSGSQNAATGFDALFANTTGTNNTASGFKALFNNTSGNDNTASGAFALYFNTTGNNNVSDGFHAVQFNTTGSDNTGSGYQALYQNTTAGENVALGSGALQTQSFSNSSTAWNSNNVAVGYQALFSNQPTTTGNGINNTAVGSSALNSNSTGTNNTASGGFALGQNSTGSNNIALGYLAGFNQTTGNNNIDIGSLGLPSDSNIIRIGSSQTDAFLTGIIHGSALRTTGNAGINVAAPVSALDVAGSGWFRADTGSLSSTASKGVRVFYDSGQSVGNIFAYDYGSGGGALNLELQQNGGRVGIGTGTPSTTLDVNGNVHISGSASVDNFLSAAGIGTQSVNTDTATINNNATIGGTLTTGTTAGGAISLLGHTGIGLAAFPNAALTLQRFGSGEVAASFNREDGPAFVQIGTPTHSVLVNRAIGLIQRTDNSSSWDVISDVRLKHDVLPVTGALETLARLRPVRYHYNADFLAKMMGAPDIEHFGVVAQEFQKVFPDFVDTDKDGMLSVRMDPIPIVTAAAVQELNAKVNERDARIEALEKENRALEQKDKTIEARLQALEARLGPADPQ